MDQTLNITLVQEVEKHPVLYNYNCPDYSKRDATEQAWNEVANAVNMTVNECKDKWRNIRTVFTRKIRFLASGPGTKRRRAYYLADAMKFAIPFIKTASRYSCGNSTDASEKDNPEIITSESLMNDDDDFYVNDPLSPQDVKSVFEEEDPLCLSVSEENPSTSIPTPTEIEKIPAKTCKRKVSDEVEGDKAISAYFNAKRAKLQDASIQRSTHEEKKDAIRMFLLSLMPELVQFSDAQIALFKRRVFRLIDAIALDEVS